MRRVCAWCNEDLGGAPESSGDVTHGMCQRCRFHVYASRGMGIHSYLEGLGAPLVVVDGEGRISAANRSARAMLDKGYPEILDLPGGEVFECAYAHLPGGCGQTEHCDACSMRRAVMETLRSGEGSDCTVTLRQKGGAGFVALGLHVSRESDGSVVLLRINSVRPVEETR